MRRAVVFLIMATMLISAFAFAPVVPAVKAQPVDSQDYKAIDIANAPLYPCSVEEPIQGPSHHSYFNVGDIAYWLVLDDYYNSVRLAPFTLVALGNVCEIWVQVSLAWRAGDTRPTPQVLDTEIAYLFGQFENNIYPTDTKYFGDPAFRDGSNAALPGILGLPADYYADPSGRSVVLVANIRDQNYYDPTYPYYVAGVFTSAYDYYFDRNTVTIDCYQWERRLGPTGTEWIQGVAVPANHAFDYEGTLAHEYQHLIHNDWQPADDLYMNEGCSMYAQVLCGYGAPVSDINSYFYTPDNSLTQWGDQGGINILADYGIAALWTIYLSDHYGGAAFISYFVETGIPGMDGVNSALAHFGYKVTFDQVYHDMRIANLVRSDFPCNGKYNYKTINLNDPAFIPVRIYETSGLPIPMTKGTDFGTTNTILGYDTGVSKIAPYGTDYVMFQNWNKLGLVSFSGDRIAGWTYDSSAGYWWSGASDLYNALLQGSAYVNPSKPYLTLVTSWGIESYWDFGFVQVSTDKGKTWTSLSNAYTTSDYDPSAHPDIIANLPGLTDYNPEWPEWTTMTFDLSAYAGQKVMIGFRYMTDWAAEYEGWFIKSASVSDNSFKLTPVTPAVKWQVTLVSVIPTCCGTVYVPVDMWLCEMTQKGASLGFANKPIYTIMIITPTMSSGWADYEFSATPIGSFWKGC
ncbi:MAG: hypothetical protein WED04_00180 [Promethearchaeati archaeon SRVP18_Atabeyarchaeia-1]